MGVWLETRWRGVGWSVRPVRKEDQGWVGLGGALVDDLDDASTRDVDVACKEIHYSRAGQLIWLKSEKDIYVA